MIRTSENSENNQQEKIEINKLASSIVSSVKEPYLVLDKDHNYIKTNDEFFRKFKLADQAAVISELKKEEGIFSELQHLLMKELSPDKNIENLEFSIKIQDDREGRFQINASRLEQPELLLISFSEIESSDDRSLDNFDEIFGQAPALICILSGPEHVYEKANKNYLDILGYRDIIGKPVREALPELEGQGFYEMLDDVYNTGKAFIGNEIPVQLDTEEEKQKKAYLDFVYQPIFDSENQVKGIFVHAIDITEKVMARRKLEESEHDLRNLIDAVPAIIWISDANGSNNYLNKKWFEFTGQSAGTVKNFGWLEAVHPEDRDRVKREFKKAISEKLVFHESFRLRNKDGNYRWVLDTGSPKFNTEGVYEGLIGMVIDVNEEKQKEQLISEKEHRIRSIIEEADVATALYTGKEMKISMANEAMINLWGKDASVIGTTLHEALPELEGQPFHDLLQGVYATGETYWGKEDPVDLVIDNKLQTGYFNFTYKALRNEDGEIYGILNMAIDVSEMVRSKELLKDSESKYRQMADLMPEKVCNFDATGKLIYFNQGWMEYTGLSKKDFEKKDLEDFIHPSQKKEFQRSWKESLATGKDFEMEVKFLNKKGKYRWHLNRAEAIFDDNGNIQIWICMATEIQKIKAEEKRKEDFLKLVSHELKTPVTSIKGYVQLLLNLLKKKEDGDLGGIPFETSLERIDQQVVRLTRLISEMLDLSRIEKNKLVLQKENFSINELVAETIQDISYTNSDYNISVINEYRTNIFADRDRIGQVLINLVTNAIKYSPQNQEVKVKIHKSGKNKVAVSVIDSGMGIDKENQKKIFKRFYRIAFKNEDTYSGFGIGLYLANEIMKRHHGKISLKSEKGKGSVFTFTLEENPDD